MSISIALASMAPQSTFSIHSSKVRAAYGREVALEIIPLKPLHVEVVIPEVAKELRRH
jgi:hypothetical protein